MVFKFITLSDEVDDFMREIYIDASATFLDLQNALLDSVGYTKDQMTSFVLCDNEWNKETEITLVEMESASDVDLYVMEKTPLEELLDEEDQRMLFIFDYMTDRCFFLELNAIIHKETIKQAKCSKSIGAPPPQTIDFEEQATPKSSSLMFDEEFYGDSDYDLDELDDEGYTSLDSLEDY